MKLPPGKLWNELSLAEQQKSCSAFHLTNTLNFVKTFVHGAAGLHSNDIQFLVFRNMLQVHCCLASLAHFMV